MGFCWNGFGWGAWGGLGIIGLIAKLVYFAGLLAVLGLGTVWLVRQLSRRPMAPTESRSSGDRPTAPGSGGDLPH
jgi:hypothetical protein